MLVRVASVNAAADAGLHLDDERAVWDAIGAGEKDVAAGGVDAGDVPGGKGASGSAMGDVWDEVGPFCRWPVEDVDGGERLGLPAGGAGGPVRLLEGKCGGEEQGEGRARE